MEIINAYGPMLKALGYIKGQPGLIKYIMPDCPEELRGPAFLRDELGQPISYHSIPGQLTIVAAGRNNPEKGILVMPALRRIVHSWTGVDGVPYKVIIEDYDPSKMGRGT